MPSTADLLRRDLHEAADALDLETADGKRDYRTRKMIPVIERICNDELNVAETMIVGLWLLRAAQTNAEMLSVQAAGPIADAG